MLPDFDPFKNVLNIKKLHDRTFLARMPNIDIIILYTGIFSDKKKMSQFHKFERTNSKNSFSITLQDFLPNDYWFAIVSWRF